MKEVLFRGKSKDTKEWVYGYVWIKETPDEKTAYIIDNQGKLTEVTLETVGQYVGLTDVNDTKIFEGDKVWCTSGVSYNGVCEFEKYFLVEYGWSESMWIILQCDTVEVIGNVFD